MANIQIEVTDELIDAAMSAAGGWSRKQLAILGVPWPPVKGWRAMLIGTKLDADKAATLILLKDAHSKTRPGESTNDAGPAACDAVEAWTDGACEPNPGIGGWGYVLMNMPGRAEPVEAHGGEMETTNNRMEMTAILEALAALPDGTQVTVYSDSQYCVKGLTVWSAGWARRNWHTKEGKPMPNLDLWLALEKQKKRLRAGFTWVRAHVGTPGNERADELASIGRQATIDQHRVEPKWSATT
jgi:ribonuclease HI